MRIEGSAYVVDISRPEAVRPAGSAPSAAQGSAQPAKLRSPDRVEFSPQARELARLQQDLAALPDVRLDRVALAKQHLQTGGYRVDPALLARKMMEETGRS